MKTYKNIIAEALGKIDEALNKFYSNVPHKKSHGLVYNLSDREGTPRPYAEVELNKEESNSVTFDDLYSVQWFHRLSEVFANENPALGYGSNSNWNTIFSMELVLSCKHRADNQLGLIDAAQYAIARVAGVMLKKIETDMNVISNREFGKNLYHIETQMILVNYEIKRNLNFNCLQLC